MADISAWSPVDESNTAAPPAGAPEGMAHSAVNNTMRAMMGAVRRFYDWTTTNIVALQNSLANYLPISGGSLTGPLGTPGLYVSGDANVSGGLGVAGNSGLAAVSATSLVVTNGVTADSVSTNTVTANSVSASNHTSGVGVNYYSNTEHNFRDLGGSISYAVFLSSGTYNVSGSWATFSDAALKTDVLPYTTRGLAAVLALRPVSFRYSGGPFAGPTVRYGLIAQEVEAHVPEMVEPVTIGGLDTLSIQPSHALLLLINSCKELAARVEVLEQRVL